MMVEPNANPHLSGPDEEPVCYSCGESIEEVPTVVTNGTPAGTILRIPEGEMVEVCDKCMSAAAYEATDDIDRILRSLGYEPGDNGR